MSLRRLVYKFGGASVKDAQGIQNLLNIVSQADGDVFVVVSAMGKTTNALERVVNALWTNDETAARHEWNDILAYHKEICEYLNVSWEFVFIQSPIEELANSNDYDELYDRIVSRGEILSTRIISTYLTQNGLKNDWLDMTQILRTDDTFREAKVDMQSSQVAICDVIEDSSCHIWIAQGFIGGTLDGRPTTLGREGSDYTAAIVGNLLDADSVTIWKDVPGILNADPRMVNDTVLIPELSYFEAVELAYSGAQIIHPKTIRPLENKQIPLFVKPFMNPGASGSIIHSTDKKIDVPVYIWRKNQMLITMRAKDFSFVLEESLEHVFDIIHKNRLKVSLIQSSAVTISVCVDSSRYVSEAISQLLQDYAVTYNENVSLLTIRGTTPEILRKESQGRIILLSQTTRRTARLIVKNE